MSSEGLVVIARAIGTGGWLSWPLIGLFVVAWALFEWRSKAESKNLIRLGAGTCVALLLFCALCLETFLGIVPLGWAGSKLPYEDPAPIAAAELAKVQSAVADVRKAVSEEDWRAAWFAARSLEDSADELRSKHAAPLLLAAKDPVVVESVRHRLDDLAKQSRQLRDGFNTDFQPEYLDARVQNRLREFSASWEALCKEIGIDPSDAAPPADETKTGG
jgi:hypothetical protein